MLLALDVGFASTGWIVFHRGIPLACGCIKTKKNELDLPKSRYRVAFDYISRSAKLAYELYRIIRKYNCKAIIGEMPTGGSQSAEAGKQMAMSMAVVSTLTKLSGLSSKSKWSTPREGKLALTEKPNADKNQMMDAAKRLYPDFEFPKAKLRFEHIADAIASYKALEASAIVREFG